MSKLKGKLLLSILFANIIHFLKEKDTITCAFSVFEYGSLETSF